MKKPKDNWKKEWGDKYSPKKTFSWETQEDLDSLGRANKMADCVEGVRNRVIASGKDSCGFSNWCPSEADFMIKVMKEYKNRFGNEI